MDAKRQVLHQVFRLSGTKGGGHQCHPNHVPVSQGGNAMDINAINSLSEAERTELMKLNACFYCKKQGHRTNMCRKKKADCKGSSSNTGTGGLGNPCACIADTAQPPTMTPIEMANYMQEHMDEFTEEDRYGFMDTLMLKDFMQAQN